MLDRLSEDLLDPIVIDKVSVVGPHCASFPKVGTALARGEVDVRRLIGTEFPLGDAEAAFRAAARKVAKKVIPPSTETAGSSPLSSDTNDVKLGRLGRFEGWRRRRDVGLNYMSLIGLLDGVNWVFDFHTGGKRRPVFFDVAETYPALLTLDRNAPAIREELMGLLTEKHAIPKYHEVDAMQHYISGRFDPEKNWKVFYLYAMGEKPAANRARCPKTAALLDEIPGLFQAFFSILDGGKSVPAHRGPYRGYIRYHLGLVVPEDNPPSIRVKDQFHTWREGQSILFDDSWEHEVINKSEGDRVVLIVDVRRPMPLPLAGLNRGVESVMRMVYGKQILKKMA